MAAWNVQLIAWSNGKHLAAGTHPSRVTGRWCPVAQLKKGMFNDVYLCVFLFFTMLIYGFIVNEGDF